MNWKSHRQPPSVRLTNFKVKYLLLESPVSGSTGPVVLINCTGNRILIQKT